MADGWALETALLSGCYAVAAVAAAAGRASVAARRGNPTPAPAPARGGGPPRDENQPAQARRRRRGKQRSAALGSGEDDRMSFSTASGAGGGGGSLHSGDSAHTGSTLRSGLSSASFGTCLSQDNWPSRQPLPMCPDDATCVLINAKDHIARFAHTCRLPMCASARDPAHCFYFTHHPAAQEQQPVSSSSGGPPAAAAPQPTRRADVSSAASARPHHHRGSSAGGRSAAAALLAIPATSTWTAGEETNSDSASPVAAGHVHADLRSSAPKARPLLVTWQTPRSDANEQHSATVHGEWGRVKVHTLRQYLRQLTGIPPSRQVLSAEGIAPQPQPAPASPPTRVLMGRGRAANSAAATVLAQHDPAPANQQLVVLLTDDTVTVAEAVRPIKVADANIIVATGTPPASP